MKVPKTIQNLLDEVEVKYISPWEDNYFPEEKQVTKNQVIPEQKKCQLCGLLVPLVWKIEKENTGGFRVTNTVPNKDYWQRNIDIWMYSLEARELHPKCMKLMEKFDCWGIPKKSISETDSFIVDDENNYAYTMVTKWISNPSSLGLYLYGPWGTGKTMLGRKIILESSIEDKLIIKEAEIYEWLTPKTNDFHRQEEIEENLEHFKHVSLLVIDDLGGSKYSDWKTEKMFEILSERIDCELPTFFTSNYNPIQLRERMDGKIVSRVFGLANPCEIGGQDHRPDRR